MLYKRGKVYWYNFRWSIKQADGTVESFRIRQTAKTQNRNAAKDVEEEHRRALRLGEIHPNDPWPKAATIGPPIFRAFAKRIPAIRQDEHKAGNAHVLQRVSGQAADLCRDCRRPAGRDYRRDSEPLRTAQARGAGEFRCDRERRSAHVAADSASGRGVGQIGPCANHSRIAAVQGRDRVLSFAEEAKYLAKASENLRDAAILAVDTGLRPNSELFPLKWADVDLTARAECPHGSASRSPRQDGQRTAQPSPHSTGCRGSTKAQEAAEAKDSAFVFAGAGISGHVTSMQHPHKAAIEAAGLETFRVLLLAAYLRNPRRAVRHGPFHSGPAHGAQFAVRGRPVLHPRHRDARCRRIREVCRVPDAQCGRGICSRVPASKRSRPIACFSNVVHMAVHSMAENDCKRLNPFARLLDSQS
jgi:hypothetical protein